MKLNPRLLFLCAWASCLASASALDVSAQSAAIFDEASGRMLWGKNADALRYPASTTKIMTALLLIERCRPEEVIVAPKDIETVTNSSMHLLPGEKITASEILYGILLRSANDACHAVAVHIAGSDVEFAKLMNQRARQIGCKNAHFHNPHGLNDKDHKVSARDLGLIACEAMKYPEFRQVVKQKKRLVTRSANQEDRWMINRNKMLWHDPTTDGIKTGYTVPAGKCFVGSATRNGYRLITVILGSQDWKADHSAMLKWAFENHRFECLVEKGSLTGQAPVAGGQSRAVPALLAGGVRLAVPKDKSISLIQKVEYFDHLKPPVRQGDRVGVWTVSDGNGWSKTVSLIAGANVDPLTTAQRARRAVWPYVIGSAVAVAAWRAVKLKRRSRRRLSFARYR